MATERTRVGVVGAGTMGAGIALVALLAGCQVALCDVQEAVLARARAEIDNRLARKVDKGEMSVAESDVVRGRLVLSSQMTALSDADLVIEAVPERMDLKQTIFRQLDEVCPASAILATNTSSLSVTVIGAQTKHPGRVVGMHFFNPAPVMRLVEVVVGEETDPGVVERVVAYAQSFDKEPAVCKDTPGFIVNRVARNFYGEALRIVGEGTASTDDVDRLMRHNAGFPLGPFRLMDMIGIDVNFDVTQSVYEAFHGEPRYRPHLLQARKVATGQLGRKTGRGFYRYDGAVVDTALGREAIESAITSTNPSDVLMNVVVVGDTPLAADLRAEVSARTGRSVEDCGIVYAGPLHEWRHDTIHHRMTRVTKWLQQSQRTTVLVSAAGDIDALRAWVQAVERGVTENTLILVSLAGPSATEQASWLAHPERVRGWCTALPLPAANSVEPVETAGAGGGPATAAERSVVAWSRPLQADGAQPCHDGIDTLAQAVLSAFGWDLVEVRDGAGGVVMRILAMVLNEAVEALREGVADADNLDAAMRLGTSYPHGPIAWIHRLGVATVWQTINALWQEHGDDRYRPSPLLRQWWFSSGAETEPGEREEA